MDMGEAGFQGLYTSDSGFCLKVVQPPNLGSLYLIPLDCNYDLGTMTIINVIMNFAIGLSSRVSLASQLFINNFMNSNITKHKLKRFLSLLLITHLIRINNVCFEGKNS